MAKTIRNEDEIVINRTIKNENGTESTSTVTIGNYYFSVSREIKQMSLQLFLNETITDENEIKQIADIYKEQIISIAQDGDSYGWGFLDIRDKTTPTT